MKRLLVLLAVVVLGSVVRVSADGLSSSTQRSNPLKWMLNDIVDNTYLKDEIGKYVFTRTVYDFHFREYLLASDISLASYRVLVVTAGGAKSLESANTRGILTGGITVDLSRSATAVSLVKRVMPEADYNFLRKLTVGGFTGYDLDRDDWRYGAHVGFAFDFVKR